MWENCHDHDSYKESLKRAGWEEQVDGSLIPPGKKGEPVTPREEAYEELSKHYGETQVYKIPFDPDEVRRKIEGGAQKEFVLGTFPEMELAMNGVNELAKNPLFSFPLKDEKALKEIEEKYIKRVSEGYSSPMTILPAASPPDMDKPPQKEVFSTGANRDSQEGKIQYSLIPYQALDALGQVLTDGAKRYGKGNYKLGIPYTRVIDSLMRHVEAIRRGKDDEPHVGQAMANLAFLAYYDDMINKGLLPKELDDRDKA